MHLPKCDIEIIILIFSLILLFCSSLKKRMTESSKVFLEIDLDMSFVMKGIACVFILMGHYVNLTDSIVTHGSLSRFVYLTSANIGLVWFMFFSGYGLSLKLRGGCKYLYINRLQKIAYPFFFVCSIATILYALLPNKFSPEDINLYRLSHYIDGIHKGEILTIIKSLWGWLDWYVYCIIIFYSIYYISSFISSKLSLNITILLVLFFACYFICAYLVFGPSEAHWYRYIWAFLLGHIIARQDKMSKLFAFVVLLPFVLLILLENKFMILSYIIAVCTLFLIGKLGKVYAVKANAPLLFVGTISYFYYLVHIRIAYNLMIYLNIISLIAWALISFIIAYLLNICFNKIFTR